MFKARRASKLQSLSGHIDLVKEEWSENNDLLTTTGTMMKTAPLARRCLHALWSAGYSDPGSYDSHFA